MTWARTRVDAQRASRGAVAREQLCRCAERENSCAAVPELAALARRCSALSLRSSSSDSGELQGC